MLLPRGIGQRRQRLEEAHQPRQDRICNLKHDVDRKDDAEQRQRHHAQRDDRNGHGVGDRRDQRRLLEQRQRQRREAQRDNPLRLRPFADCVDKVRSESGGCGRTQAAGRRVQQQPDGTEGEPEPRRERGPRVPQHYGGESPQPHDAGGTRAAQPQAARGDGQHGERPHRGHLRASEQDISPCRDDACGRRQLSRRDVRRQPRTAPGERIRQAAGEGREHRDVQPGDADQMRDAGAVEHRPLRLRNGTLVAYGQRDDDASVRRAPQRRDDSPANLLPGTLHVIARASRKKVTARIEPSRMHIPGRAQSLLQQPCLEIEAAGVDGAVRALKSHGEVPAFAGVDHRRLLVRKRRVQRSEPRQRKPRWHHGAWRAHLLDREREARALR